MYDGDLHPRLPGHPGRHPVPRRRLRRWSTCSSTSSTGCSTRGSGSHEHHQVERRSPSPSPASGGSRRREALRRLRAQPDRRSWAWCSSPSSCWSRSSRRWIAPYTPTDDSWLDQIRPGHVPRAVGRALARARPRSAATSSRGSCYGARQSLLIGVVSLALGAAVGIALGVLAGAFGGWVDTLIMRLVDIMLAVPGLLFAIAVAALLGRSLTSVMIAIAVVNVPIFARLLRGVDARAARADYVLAARSLGRQALGDRVPARAAELVRPGHRAGHADAGDGDHRRRRPGVPRPGSGSDPSAPEWGRMLADAQEYADQTRPAGALPRRGHRARRARLQPARRRAARGPRPEVRGGDIH